MKITDVEKIILINQYKILAQLYPEDKETYEKNIEILVSGYTSQYEDLCYMGTETTAEKQKTQCSAHKVAEFYNAFRKLMAKIYAFFSKRFKSKKPNADDEQINISFEKIDRIKNMNILDDYLGFLENEYMEIANRLSNLSEKYNFVVTVISILLGSNIVLLPQILIKNDGESNKVTTISEAVYILSSVILVIIFCIFLRTYRKRTDYQLINEFKLIDTIDSYPKSHNYKSYKNYKKEKAKILLSIVYDNYKIIEARKKAVKNLILPIEICSIGIVISALMILYHTKAENTFNMIIDIIKSFFS